MYYSLFTAFRCIEMCTDLQIKSAKVLISFIFFKKMTPVSVMGQFLANEKSLTSDFHRYFFKWLGNVYVE